MIYMIYFKKYDESDKEQIHGTQEYKDISTRGRTIQLLLLEEAAAANGIPFRPAVEADDTGLLKALAKSASVIAFLPEYSVRKELEAKELKIIAPSDFDMTLYCQILYHKSKVVTHQMHIFIDLLKDHLSSSRVPIQK